MSLNVRVNIGNFDGYVGKLQNCRIKIDSNIQKRVVREAEMNLRLSSEKLNICKMGKKLVNEVVLYCIWCLMNGTDNRFSACG